MLTATGLGSGLDIQGLVSQLVSSERAGSDLQLARQTNRYTSKFSALGTLKSSLSTFQGSISSLDILSNYSKNSATSSETTELTVTANGDAVPNDYQIEISQLASTHSLASAAFTDSDTSTLGTGTLTIRRGTTDYTEGTDTYNGFTVNPDVNVANITIDTSNNTLEGIMGAINDADVGINAAIVNDGSGFHLLLTSEDTGEANSLEISVSDDDSNNTDNAGLSRFAFNSTATNLDQTSAASDAAFTINGLAVNSASNVSDTAIEGVTLSLKKVSSGIIDVGVSQDFSAIESGIDTFIAGYNQFINTVNTLSAYDAENNIPSALVGDFTLRSIEGQVGNLLRSPVEGLSGSITTMSALGISTTSTGTLTLNSSTLKSALEEDPQQVLKIFAAVGSPDDTDISYNGATRATLVGEYAINIDTIASSGIYTGTSTLPDFGSGGTLVIDSSNDNYSFEVNGIDSGEITLTANTYTSGQELANDLQVQINGSSALSEGGVSVTVSYDSGSNSISITSDTLGSTSSVNVLTAETADIGFSVGAGTDGVDVAGTIDGVAATGLGNVLIGADGTNAEGLSLIIGGTTLGARGDVAFTRGLSNQLDSLFDAILQDDGALDTRIENYKTRLEEIDTRKEAMEIKWEAVEARYQKQFNALDTLLSNLESTSSYLENQFENLVKPKGSS